MFLLLALLLPAQDDLERRIEEILPRLAAEDIDVREGAARDLSALGPAALPLLQRRAASLEGESRARVEEACRRIEKEKLRASVLPPLRLVTLVVQERPAKEVVEAIAKRIGAEIDAGTTSLDAPITLTLKDATPFRALEEACRKAGDFSFEPMQGRAEQDPDDDVPAQLAGEAGKGARFVLQPVAAPPYPVAHVRHYRVRVTQITITRQMDFRQNRSNAHLQFDVQWLPGATPLALSRFTVEEAVDDQGRSLLPEKAEERMPFGRRVTRGYYGARTASFPHTFSFPVPPADAKKIAVLRGTAVLAYPGETRALVFEKPFESGKSLELNGLKVTLKEAREAEGSLNIVLELGGRYAGRAGDGDDALPFAYEDVRPVTESGKRLRSRGMSGRGDGQTTTWTLRYAPAPGDALKEIRIPCVLDRFEDEVKFEIRDIPLPR